MGVKAETIESKEEHIDIPKDYLEPVHHQAIKIDKPAVCQCGGRIVKTKSGVLTCEDCFNEY